MTGSPDGSTSAGDDDAGSTTTDAGTDGATSAGFSFSPSNIGTALAGVDTSKLIDFDISGTANQISVACDSTGDGGCYAAMVTQSDGSNVQVYFAKSWKIEPNAVLSVTDKVPIVVVALTTIEILGQLPVNATADQSTAGGAMGGGGGGVGSGVAGGGADSSHVGVGGGGGSYCGAGGAGGLASSSMGGAGKTYGNAIVSPLLSGSAGGGASFPGAGGGAIQLVAGTSIDIGATGIIAAGGGGGVSGSTTGYYVSTGAGSGGAILLEAPTVTVEGTLAANGGGGGAGSGASTAQGHGADATNTSTPAQGANQGTTGVGGNGAAGTTITGTSGANGDAVGGDALPGAGGGGAGWIRINSRTGAATVTGTVTPTFTTTCATQGTLAP